MAELLDIAGYLRTLLAGDGLPGLSCWGTFSQLRAVQAGLQGWILGGRCLVIRDITLRLRIRNTSGMLGLLLGLRFPGRRLVKGLDGMDCLLRSLVAVQMASHPLVSYRKYVQECCYNVSADTRPPDRSKEIGFR